MAQGGMSVMSFVLIFCIWMKEVMVLVLRLVSPPLATAFVEFCRVLYCIALATAG